MAFRHFHFPEKRYGLQFFLVAAENMLFITPVSTTAITDDRVSKSPSPSIITGLGQGTKKCVQQCTRKKVVFTVVRPAEITAI
jgi:hypothetical protein